MNICSGILFVIISTLDIVCFLISETVAFHAVLTSYSSIAVGAPVLFNLVELNYGDGQVFSFYQL